MQRRIFTVFALFLVIALMLPVIPASATTESVATTAQSQVEGETFRIGTNAEYPPFESVDEDGNIIGFDIELMEAIAADAGFEIEWVNTRWDGIFVALSEGEFDAVISAATITEEREEIIDFSDPYFNAGQIIAVSADDAENISEPEDLEGLRIGVQLGTTGDFYAAEIEGTTVERYDEITLAFQALGQGEVDAVIADSPTAADIIANNPDLNLTTVGEPLTDEFYGVAVNPERPELLEAINASLANVIADGAYAEIYESYFGNAPPAGFLEQDEMMLDSTDPVAVFLYFYEMGIAGDIEAVEAVSCEEILGTDSMPTEDDAALFEGIEFDFSTLEFEVTYNDDETEAYVTPSGIVTITIEDQSQEVTAEELFTPETRLVLDGENWLFCESGEAEDDMDDMEDDMEAEATEEAEE